MIFCRSILTFSRFKIRTRTSIRFCSEKSSIMSLRIPVQKVLCVAEKNDAAKGISDIMSNGRMRRREGFSKYNKIYEYEYHLFGKDVTVIMTSVSGHLLGMDFQRHLKSWHSCNPVSLFDAEVEKFCPDDMVNIKRTLEREVRACQVLVIWTDCDREGENIGFEVIDVCKAVKPNLQVFRARFSEITPRSISTACQNFIPPDQNTTDAVDVRMELDLRIGAAFTRFQTLRLQKIFPSVLSNQLISYGSCQFPTLGFVVERFKAIQAFIPEAFYKIRVTHEHEDGNVEFSWKRHRLFNHTACLVLYQICMEDPTATVVQVGSKPKSKWRPVALDTVEMEKLVSRKMKIGAKETMKIAEKLYTQGYISYPRTETNIFPKDLNLTPLVEQQTQDPQWGGFAQRILERGGPTPRNGNKSDQAHPPIHPTKYASNLQGNEQRIYEFIVRHFLACCSQDAQGQETTVEIDIAAERFVAHGLMIIARNYLDVYPYDKWNTKVIPVYEMGERFQPTLVEMVDGETSPPQLLTEADLISLMEKHGIGTDATHADHIETIKSRMYVGLTPEQRFLPGELGMGLVEGYDSMGFEMSKPDLRAELEADLKLVCEGKKDKFTVLRQQVQNYKQVFIEAAAKATKLDEALSQYFGQAAQPVEQQEIYPETPLPIRKCPQCNRDMVLKTKKDGGFYISCLGYPSCKTSIWLPNFVLEVSRDDSVCDVCRPHPIHKLKLKFKRGSVPPIMPLEFVGCIGGCDETLREILDLKYLQGGSRAPQPGLPRESNRAQVNQRNNRITNDRDRGGPNRQPPAKKERKPQLVTPAIQRNAPPTSANPENNEVVCNCGVTAVQLTVRKEGPNQGRPFYKCDGGKCNFFLWADQENGDSRSPPALQVSAGRPSTSFNSSRAPEGSRMAGGSGDSGLGGETKCMCNQPAITRTVQKDGANKGRPFHTCSKPREQQCGFFQWADENIPPGPSGDFPTTFGGGSGAQRGFGQKNKRTDNAEKAPTAKRPRTCGICHQPGHNRTNCPQNR
ncbi:DNA topoisomerase 3-alpha [Rana temporaria]|uniref:DNA topoisomerase 3-alpha n=1 Tax=Rana temporaria TaxID=8407 RepID=UPI001AADCDC2|nr:DNA topoisomerase 3-alpha [Rana temporaria]